MRSKFEKHFHLLFEEDVPPNSFLVNGNTHDVPCVFQIWIKKNESRQLDKIVYTSNYFKFVKKQNTPIIKLYTILYKYI